MRTCSTALVYHWPFLFTVSSTSVLSSCPGPAHIPGYTKSPPSKNYCHDHRCKRFVIIKSRFYEIDRHHQKLSLKFVTAQKSVSVTKSSLKTSKIVTVKFVGAQKIVNVTKLSLQNIAALKKFSSLSEIVAVKEIVVVKFVTVNGIHCCKRIRSHQNRRCCNRSWLCSLYTAVKYT